MAAASSSSSSSSSSVAVSDVESAAAASAAISAGSKRRSGSSGRGSGVGSVGDVGGVSAAGGSGDAKGSSESNSSKSTSPKRATGAAHTAARAASLTELLKFYEWLCAQHLTNPQQAIDQIFSICALTPDYYKKVSNGVLPYLMALTSGDLLGLLSGREDDDLPCLLDIITQNKIFYAALHCLKDASTGQALGKLLISDLAFVAGKLNADGTPHKRVSIFIDEASEIAGESLVQLLNKSRAANFNVTIATQSVADLSRRAGSKDAAAQIIANCNNIISLRVNDPETANVISSVLTTTVVGERSSSTSFNEGLALNDSYNTSRTVTHKETQLFPPSLLMKLPDFEFIARLANGEFYKGFIPLLTAPEVKEQPAGDTTSPAMAADMAANSVVTPEQSAGVPPVPSAEQAPAHTAEEELLRKLARGNGVGCGVGSGVDNGIASNGERANAHGMESGMGSGVCGSRDGSDGRDTTTTTTTTEGDCSDSSCDSSDCDSDAAPRQQVGSDSFAHPADLAWAKEVGLHFTPMDDAIAAGGNSLGTEARFGGIKARVIATEPSLDASAQSASCAELSHAADYSNTATAPAPDGAIDSKLAQQALRADCNKFEREFVETFCHEVDAEKQAAAASAAQTPPPWWRALWQRSKATVSATAYVLLCTLIRVLFSRAMLWGMTVLKESLLLLLIAVLFSVLLQGFTALGELAASISYCGTVVLTYCSVLWRVLTEQFYTLNESIAINSSAFALLKQVGNAYWAHIELAAAFLCWGILFGQRFSVLAEMRHRSLMGVKKFTSFMGWPSFVLAVLGGTMCGVMSAHCLRLHL